MSVGRPSQSISIGKNGTPSLHRHLKSINVIPIQQFNKSGELYLLLTLRDRQSHSSQLSNINWVDGIVTVCSNGQTGDSSLISELSKAVRQVCVLAGWASNVPPELTMRVRVRYTSRST